jgi:CheY-like chemotaxis protein
MTHSGRVVLVEDDKFLRRACEASLRQRGFDVAAATDGEEGLRLAKTPPLADVVLLDLLMPKLPGIEVLRALKADPATAGIPVLILSNSSREDDKRQAEQLGASGYYVKANLSLKELAAQVEQLVQHARTRKQSLEAVRITPGASA